MILALGLGRVTGSNVGSFFKFNRAIDLRFETSCIVFILDFDPEKIIPAELTIICNLNIIIIRMTNFYGSETSDEFPAFNQNFNFPQLRFRLCVFGRIKNCER